MDKYLLSHIYVRIIRIKYTGGNTKKNKIFNYEQDAAKKL